MTTCLIYVDEQTFPFLDSLGLITTHDSFSRSYKTETFLVVLFPSVLDLELSVCLVLSALCVDSKSVEPL